MDHKNSKPMTPFDNMVTPPNLYTLKLLLPYTPSSNQRTLGIYIKFMELQYAMDHFFGFSAGHLQAQSANTGNPFGIFEELKPYMAKEDMEKMEQMEMMMNMMEMVQGMQNEGGSSIGSGSFNPMDMMMGMLGPDQQDIFQTYSSMFDADLNSTAQNLSEEPEQPYRAKGDNIYEYESMDESSRNEEYRSGKTGTY